MLLERQYSYTFAGLKALEPLTPIKFSRRLYLATLGVLSSNRQAHGMPPPPIRAHLSQQLDIVADLTPLVVLNLHRRQLRRDVQ